MKGYIKIEATTHEGRDGLSIETQLENVSYMDRLQVLHSVCHALKLDADELDLMAHLMRDGIIDAAADIQVLRDDTPEIHVIGVEAGSKGLAALLKMLLS